MAYTAAKPGFDIDWCKQCDQGLPKPDLVCFMDTKLTSIDSRQNFGDERYETNEFQKIVYQNFKQLFDLNQSTDACFVLDAKDSIESLHKQILGRMDHMLKNNQFIVNDMKTLW